MNRRTQKSQRQPGRNTPQSPQFRPSRTSALYLFLALSSALLLSGCRPTPPPEDPHRAITMEEALSKSNTLENLDLFNRRLTNFPPAILDFKSLEKLTLRTCNIGRLPDEFGSLSLLKQLDVGQTGLTNLTPAIGQLKQLTHLWLNDNPLPALPPEISVLSSLVYLNADRTFLSQLPEEIGALPNLRCLRLNHNRLTAMPADMSGLAKNLEILYLIGNPIPETEQQRIKAALPGCKVLFQPGRPERK